MINFKDEWNWNFNELNLPPKKDFVWIWLLKLYCHKDCASCRSIEPRCETGTSWSCKPLRKWKIWMRQGDTTRLLHCCHGWVYPCSADPPVGKESSSTVTSIWSRICTFYLWAYLAVPSSILTLCQPSCKGCPCCRFATQLMPCMSYCKSYRTISNHWVIGTWLFKRSLCPLEDLFTPGANGWARLMTKGAGMNLDSGADSRDETMSEDCWLPSQGKHIWKHVCITHPHHPPSLTPFPPFFLDTSLEWLHRDHSQI